MRSRPAAISRRRSSLMRACIPYYRKFPQCTVIQRSRNASAFLLLFSSEYYMRSSRHMTAVLFIGECVSHPARCGKNAGAFLNFDGESPAIRSPAVPSERIWKYFALSVAFPSQKCAKDARDIPQCKSTEKNGSPENCIINKELRKQETARPRSFRDVQWRESSLLICIHFNVLSSDKSMNHLYRFEKLSEFLF